MIITGLLAVFAEVLIWVLSLMPAWTPPDFLTYTSPGLAVTAGGWVYKLGDWIPTALIGNILIWLGLLLPVVVLAMIMFWVYKALPFT